MSTQWTQWTVALLAGLVAFSILLVGLTVTDVPAYEPAAAAVFIWVTVAGVVSYWLVTDGERSGYLLSLLTGVLALLFVGLMATETLRAESSAPLVIDGYLSLSYGALGLLLAVVAGYAVVQNGTGGSS